MNYSSKLTERNKELYDEIGHLIREINSMKDNISKVFEVLKVLKITLKILSICIY